MTDIYSEVKTLLQLKYPSRFIEGTCLGAIEDSKIGIMANHYFGKAYLGDNSQGIKTSVVVSIYGNTYSDSYTLAKLVLNDLIAAKYIVQQALTSTYSNVLEKYVIEFIIKGE